MTNTNNKSICLQFNLLPWDNWPEWMRTSTYTYLHYGRGLSKKLDELTFFSEFKSEFCIYIHTYTHIHVYGYTYLYAYTNKKYIYIPIYIHVCVFVWCVCSYLPLPMEGKATDLSFFSSARARQFFTVLSSSSSHLSEPQPGLLQWMTYLAGRPKPAVNTADGWTRKEEEEWSVRWEDEKRKERLKRKEEILTLLVQQRKYVPLWLGGSVMNQTVAHFHFECIVCINAADLAPLHLH